MPAVVRELSIVYGATTVGGTTDRLLDYPIDVIESADRGSLRFRFTTSAATEAAFDAEVAALEAAFRDVRLRLRLIQGAATLYDWDPATNTGFNHVARIDKVGEDAAHTGRTRAYEVTIEFELPADVYDQSGRRHAHVIIDYTPARKRRLTITGEYTATGGNGARAQYQANIGAYATTLTGGLGGTWELAEETHDEDETDKVLRFRRVYDQVISDQSSSGLGDTAIVRHALSISVMRPRPGDGTGGGEVKRPLEATARYQAWVDRDVSTDLENIYTSRLRSWLVDRVEAVANGDQAAVVEESPEYDAPENRISVSLRILITDGGSLLAYSETAEAETNAGWVFVPTWSGNRWAKYVYQGPATARRTWTITRRVLGAAAFAAGGRRFDVGFEGAGPQGVFRGGPGFGKGLSVGGKGGGGNIGSGAAPFRTPRSAKDAGGAAGTGDTMAAAIKEHGEVPTAGTWREVSRRATATPVRIGSTEHHWDATDLVLIRVEEYAESPLAGPVVTG